MRTHCSSRILAACLSLFALSAAAISPAFAAAPPRLKDLGTEVGDASMPLPPGACINAHGQILGQTSIGAGSTGQQPVLAAFLYNNGRLVRIGPMFGGTNTTPIALNDRGQALVQSDNGSAFVYHNGRSFPIFPLPGGSASTAVAINANGQVIGNTGGRGFLWDRHNGTWDIGTLNPTPTSGELSGSMPLAINDSGLVVGSADTPGSGTHAFVFDGVIHDLGTLSPNNYGISMAKAINSSGQVIGDADAPSLMYGTATHGFVWDRQHGMRDLGTLWPAQAQSVYCYVTSTALGINARGQIIGTSTLVDSDTNVTTYAFLWTPGGRDGVPGNPQMKPLALGGYYSSPVAINANGDVTGYSDTDTGNQHAFVYSGGIIRDITPLTYDTVLSTPVAINSRGQVVGYFATDGGAFHPFLFERGSFTDLGTLGGDSVASGINDEGLITGTSKLTADPTSVQHAWVTGPHID